MVGVLTRRRRACIPYLDLYLWSHVACFLCCADSVTSVVCLCKEHLTHRNWFYRVFAARAFRVSVSLFSPTFTLTSLQRLQKRSVGFKLVALGDMAHERLPTRLFLFENPDRMPCFSDPPPLFRRHSRFGWVFGRNSETRIINTYISRQHFGVRFPTVVELLQGFVARIDVMGTNGLYLGSSRDGHGKIFYFMHSGRSALVQHGDWICLPTEESHFTPDASRLCFAVSNLFPY